MSGYSTQENQFNRILCACAALAVFVVVWFRPEPPTLFGVDAGVYARVARESALRPIGEWPQLTWNDGESFFEHPPLALWIESLAFRLGGANARTALTVARLWATLLAAATAWVAWRLHGVRMAALSLFGLLTLSGFLFESQNPMLDLPLTACMTSALAALTVPGAAGAVAFVAFAVAAFWIKGPPALALLVPAVWWLGWRRKRWWLAVVAVISAVVAVIGSVEAFDAVREVRGVPPFFSTYFTRQVLVSFTSGRHHASNDWFYYAAPLAVWYLPGLVALPLVWWRQRRAASALLSLATLWLCCIVLGFTLATQKWEFYIHPVMPGAAWLVAMALEPWLAPAERPWLLRAPPWIAGFAVLWAISAMLIDQPSSKVRAAAFAVAHTTPPVDAVVADCSTLNTWRAQHLFAFYWHAQRVDCADPAAHWVFDGAQIQAR